TIPMISLFNRMLEIDEDEFMRQTKASFKLGIEFVNWGRLGDRYIHGFGVIGQDNWTVDFHQYWLKQHLAGDLGGGNLLRFGLGKQLARADRCRRGARVGSCRLRTCSPHAGRRPRRS
ncbi:MAG: tryptophan 7-halogenase, partial [Betaproteobacteria bacterium]